MTYSFQCAWHHDDVKYHIILLKHSYNTIILTESTSYQLLKYIVASSATP